MFPETRHLFIFLPKGKVWEFWFQSGIYGRNEKSQGISEFSKKNVIVLQSSEM